MTAPRRRFKRPLGERRYKKLFVVATEGYITEPQYFNLFQRFQSIVQVKCLKDKSRNSPPQVLRRLQSHLKTENFQNSDEAWLVIDKDDWTDNQLSQLYNWSTQSDSYGFALSNPNFEYWLLLHFDDGLGIANSHECLNRLRTHLQDYDKSINQRRFTFDSIQLAVQRAENRDTPPCANWPQASGTTVYRLVKRIIADNQDNQA